MLECEPRRASSWFDAAFLSPMVGCIPLKVCASVPLLSTSFSSFDSRQMAEISKKAQAFLHQPTADLMRGSVVFSNKRLSFRMLSDLGEEFCSVLSGSHYLDVIKLEDDVLAVSTYGAHSDVDRLRFGTLIFELHWPKEPFLRYVVYDHSKAVLRLLRYSAPSGSPPYFLMSCSNDKTVKMWDVADRDRLPFLRPKSQKTEAMEPKAVFTHSVWVCSAAQVFGTRLIAYGGASGGGASIGNVETGASIGVVPLPSSQVWSAGGHRRLQNLAIAGGSDCRISVIDTRQLAVVQKWSTDRSSWVQSLKVVDENIVVAIGNNGKGYWLDRRQSQGQLKSFISHPTSASTADRGSGSSWGAVTQIGDSGQDFVSAFISGTYGITRWTCKPKGGEDVGAFSTTILQTVTGQVMSGACWLGESPEGETDLSKRLAEEVSERLRFYLESSLFGSFSGLQVDAAGGFSLTIPLWARRE